MRMQRRRSIGSLCKWTGKFYVNPDRPAQKSARCRAGSSSAMLLPALRDHLLQLVDARDRTAVDRQNHVARLDAGVFSRAARLLHQQTVRNRGAVLLLRRQRTHRQRPDALAPARPRCRSSRPWRPTSSRWSPSCPCSPCRATPVTVAELPGARLATCDGRSVESADRRPFTESDHVAGLQAGLGGRAARIDRADQRAFRLRHAERIRPASGSCPALRRRDGRGSHGRS